MKGEHPALDKQRHKIEAATAPLIRHEKMTGRILILLVVLNAVLLALVVDHLWGHPWTPESIKGLIP